jgi:predicted transcriptional regulator
LSFQVEHNNDKERDRIDWRRIKVQELSSQGHSQSEIAQILQVSNGTVNRDLSILRQQAKSNIKKYIECYHCDILQTDIKKDYESHVINKHGLGHPCFPSKTDLEKLGLKPQGKSWEI